jgi:DNA-binding NtrC family response regulator
VKGPPPVQSPRAHHDGRTGADKSLSAHATALVIEPSSPWLLQVLTTLSSLGLDTTVAETFHDARTTLCSTQVSVLVTAIRLHDYNGLHLVLRGTTAWPGLAAVVTCSVADAVLQSEAERLGATFVVMPVSPEDLAAAVCRTILRTPQPGADLDPIRPPFERRSRELKKASAALEGVATGIDRRRSVAEAIRALA